MGSGRYGCGQNHREPTEARSPEPRGLARLTRQTAASREPWQSRETHHGRVSDGLLTQSTWLHTPKPRVSQRRICPQGRASVPYLGHGNVRPPAVRPTSAPDPAYEDPGGGTARSTDVRSYPVDRPPSRMRTMTGRIGAKPRCPYADGLPVRPPHLSRSRVLLGMRLDGVSAEPAVGDAAQDRDGRGQGPAFVVSKVFDVG